MKDEIKNIIDNKIASLFERKVNPNDYDPAFTKSQNELRYVLHTATIMNGQILEEAYLNALKLELTNCEVWEDKKFQHLNFTKLIKLNKIKIIEKNFIKTDQASHLNENGHLNIFTKNIIAEIDRLEIKN